MTMYNTPIEQISDGNGKPVVGAKKFLFNVGTTVKKTIYSDADLTIARDNPVLSDGDGRFPQFYLDGLYDEIQQDNSGTETGYDGVTIWGPLQVGEVPEGPLELWETDQTYNIPDIVLGSDDNYYRSLTDTNQGNNPVSSPGSWEQLQFGRVWNTNVTYAKGDTVYASDGYLYISIVDSNTANNPVSSPTQWRPAANVMQSAIAAGTVDAITATFPIPFTALNDQAVVSVRATGANTSTTPTINVDTLGAKTIVKKGNQALIAGNIFGDGHELILKYNSTNDNFELLNPEEDIISVGDTLNSSIEVSLWNNIKSNDAGGNATVTPVTSTETDLVTLGSMTVSVNDIIYIQGYATGTKGVTAGGVEMKVKKSSGLATIIAYEGGTGLDHVLGGAPYVAPSQQTTGLIVGWLRVTGAGDLTLKMTGTSYGSDFTGGTQRFSAMVLRGGA